MRYIALTLSILAVVFLANIAQAKGLEIQKASDDIQVKVVFDRESPVVGDNHLTLEIKNTSGTVIKDSPVRIEYSMPAMPGMAAMNYKTDAEADGALYKAKVNLSMSGPWNFVIKIKVADKISSVKFNVDAR